MVKARANVAAAPDVILASASPRRRELLERLGLALEILPADVDESALPGRDRRRLRPPGRRRQVRRRGRRPGRRARSLPVLAADTTVVVDGAILGKPADDADGRAMLRRLAGRRHEVVTAYTHPLRRRARLDRAVTTMVAMRALQPAEIDAYVAPASGATRRAATRCRGSRRPSSPSCAGR